MTKTKRNYKLQDVYDYLQRFYGLEWRRYQIKDHQNERTIRSNDFSDINEDGFYVVAIVYQDLKRKTVSLNVDNNRLEIYEINPHLHHYKQPSVSWRKYLQLIRSKEHTLIQ